ncbi:N-acetyltransferase [Bowmanella denitrificans]|uniref:N-acetyltransferase n=1 Tax=Bowmanella denitrificans TaxID=366582 RepID=A0ABN0XH27_9ALTE
MIKPITKAEFGVFWPTFADIIQARETYAFDPDMTLEQAYQLWCLSPQRAYAYMDEGEVLGTYYLRPNAMGPSRHISNCGYMVAPEARGKGVARKMCEHSQQIALELGYKAMQFNSVVSTNKVAINLWQTLGFEIIGTIPRAYEHGQLGYVDSYVMYKWLLS